MDSPLILTPTPGTTTICPTVILRVDPLTPGRRKRNFKMTVVEVGSRDSMVQETHKHFKPLLPTTHRRARRQSRQLKSKTVIGLSVFLSDCTGLVNSDHSAGDDLLRMGRVAIMRDIGAATCVYHLIIKISSRTLRAIAVSRRHYISCTRARSPLPHFARISITKTRTGDWTIGRVPSPSTKSIYRLAEKVTVLTIV